MPIHVRRTLALLVVIVAISMAGGAAQQSAAPVGRVVYESCYADLNLWDVICDVHVWSEGSDGLFASGGRLPRWSPDATKIAYVAYGYSAYGQVIVADVNNPANAVMITTDPSSVYTVEWFAGGRLAFVSERTGAAELHSANADGTGVTQLTSGIAFTGSYAIAPSGSTIALALRTPGGMDLFRINADGSGLLGLTSNGAYSGGRMTWSRDSTRLVFDCAGRICGVNADGSGFAPLTPDGTFGGALSPAGDRLAHAASFDGQYETVVKEPDGSLLRLASDTPGHTPVWSSDGTRILFEGTTPLGYTGGCYFGGGADPGDGFCLPRTGIYLVTEGSAGVRLVTVGSDPHWREPVKGEPSASFTAGCTGRECTFDGSASSDPDGHTLRYDWRFGDGTSASGTTVRHSYETAGIYTVALTVTDAQGLSSSSYRTVVANTPPVASFTHSCLGATCTFDASGSRDDGTILDFYWNFGDGASDYGVRTVHVFPTGTFTVRVTAVDNIGASDSAVAIVTVNNPPPVPAFTVSCSGFECTFDATGTTDDGPFWATWDFGDGTSATFYSGSGGISTSHRYAAPGTYSVTLTVRDTAGQTDGLMRTAIVNPDRMHVGDIDSARISTSRGWWYPTVTITVHGADERRLFNVYVSGRWSTGETLYCFTNETGQCSVYGPQLKGGSSISFTILTVAHEAYGYNPAANHDPDGDSNGSTINVSR